MRILFITSTRIGDGVLSTAALNYLIHTYPDARITVACGPLIKALFAQFPAVEKVIALKKKRLHLHWLTLWAKVGLKRWDMVVDLRNSAVSRMVYAPQKYILHKQDRNLHKVEQLAAMLHTSTPLQPTLVFKDKVLRQAGIFIPDQTPVLAVCPTANWPGKMWPADSFIALIQQLTTDHGLFPHAKVAVIAGPGEEDTAYTVFNALPEEQRINLIAKTPIEVSAAALKLCTFYIGNDSGLTHCAAAVGTPTLALFGPTRATEYRPWGTHCAYVTTPETPEELAGYEGFNPDTVTESLMHSLSVAAVYDAAEALYRKAFSRSS